MAGVDPTARIAGVRLAGDSRVTFIAPPDGDLQNGQAVRVAIGSTIRTGLVVIAPGQIVGGAFEGELARLAGLADDSDLAASARSGTGYSSGGRIGSHGRIRPSSRAGQDWLPPAGPRLGDELATAHGSGYARNVNTAQRQATVRLDSGEDLTVTFDALLNPEV